MHQVSQSFREDYQTLSLDGLDFATFVDCNCRVQQVELGLSLSGVVVQYDDARKGLLLEDSSTGKIVELDINSLPEFAKIVPLRSSRQLALISLANELLICNPNEAGFKVVNKIEVPKQLQPVYQFSKDSLILSDNNSTLYVCNLLERNLKLSAISGIKGGSCYAFTEDREGRVYTATSSGKIFILEVIMLS